MGKNPSIWARKISSLAVISRRFLSVDMESAGSEL